MHRTQYVSEIKKWNRDSDREPYRNGRSSGQWPHRHNRHGPKRGVVYPFRAGSWVLIEHNVAWAETYLCTKWHLDPSSRSATKDMGRKLGAAGYAPFLGGGKLGPHLTQCRRGQDLPPPTKWHRPISWSIQPFGHNGQAAVPMLGELDPYSPSNTMSPGAEVYLPSKWHLVPSSRLATTDTGRILGAAVSFWWGELDSWYFPIQHNIAWSEAYLSTKWHIDPSSHFATTDWPRSGGCCAPFIGGAGGRAAVTI